MCLWSQAKWSRSLEVPVGAETQPPWWSSSLWPLVCDVSTRIQPELYTKPFLAWRLVCHSVFKLEQKVCFILYVSYHQISISGEFLWNIHHCARTGRRSLFERRREEILEKALFSFTSFWNLLCPQRKNKGQKEKKKHPFAKRHFMNMKLKRSLCGHLKICPQLLWHSLL